MDNNTPCLRKNPVRIPSRDVFLDGELVLPASLGGIILFAHGSGSSRLSPRNQYVAGVLNEQGLGTLLMDLLTRQEEQFDIRTAQLRFDINFLAERLVDASDWLAENPQTASLPLGYFGASTGAAAALLASTKRPNQVKAIVSRGGRPDLAESALGAVTAATLLIVGGADPDVAYLNRQALALMTRAPVKHLEIVPGATHLFPEDGALESVAALAGNWFTRHLSRGQIR